MEVFLVVLGCYLITAAVFFYKFIQARKANIFSKPTKRLLWIFGGLALLWPVTIVLFYKDTLS